MSKWARPTYERASIGLLAVESSQLSIDMASPAEDVTVAPGDVVTIQWADAYDNAQIDLAYDPDDDRTR